MKILAINAKTLKITGLYNNISEIVNDNKFKVASSNLYNFLNLKRFGNKKLNILSGHYFIYVDLVDIDEDMRKYIENKAKVISRIKSQSFAENFNDENLKLLWG